MNFSAIGIVSPNIQESLNFYSHFNMTFKSYSEGHYECTLNNGLRIMIDSLELMQKINPDFVAPDSSHISLCFKMDSPEQVNQLVAQLKSAGYAVAKEPWDAFWGQRYAVVTAPDNTPVDIFANLNSKGDS